MPFALISFMLKRLPLLPKRLIHRETALRKLGALSQHALSVVCAPAGYGKTTLAIQIANGLRMPFLYLELDAKHGLPVRFYGALLQSLRQIWPDFAATLPLPAESSAWPAPELMREAILEDLSDRAEHFVTFFDDSAQDREGLALANLAGFLEVLPPQVHVVLLCREKPNLALSRWRLKGQLLEMGAEDLSLSRAETATFIRDVAKLSLSEAAVDHLYKLSEGWVAGLQMLTLRLQSEADPSTAVLRMQGDHAFLFEYLMDEVLGQLPPDRREFLLSTSVLPKLVPAACDAVAERSDSAVVLAEFAERNGFVTPCGGGAYRYHRLFADGLQGLLRQRQPGLLPALHRRAARWHLLNGGLEEAFDQALNAGDADMLEALAARALENIFRNGDFVSLQRHAPRIPEVFSEERPTLALFLAWAFFHLGREEAGRLHLERAQKSLRNQSQRREEGGAPRRLLAHASLLRSLLLRLSGDTPRAMQLAYRACMLAPPEDRFLRASLQLQIGIDAFLTGQLDVAVAAFEDAMELADASEHHLAYFGAGYSLAEIWSLQGRLERVQRLTQTLEDYGRRSPAHGGPAAGYAALARARALLIQGRVEEARGFLDAGLALGRQGGNIRILNYGYAAQAMALAQLGQAQAAVPLLQQAEAFAHRNRMHWAIDLDDLEAMRLRLRLSLGEKADASTWLLRSRPRLRKPLLADWDLARTSIEVLLYLGRSAEALPVLDTWSVYLERLDLRVPLAEWLLLHAAVEQARGRRDHAREKLMEGLQACCEIGAHGLPMSLRSWLKPIADACPHAHGLSAEVAGLLELLKQEAGEILDVPALGADILSEREIEVLRAMREGKSNKEIAVTLFVAPSTVKTHLKNIFAKMGVSNRTRAVTLAEASGILR